MKAKILAPVILTLLSLFLISATAGAESIKDRMIKRLPVINQLKADGIIGENKAGLLQYRSGNRPSQNVINAENADRKKIYAQIAKKQNASPAQVGSRRAIQIAKNAKPGTWLQKQDGAWYRK